MNHHLLRSAFIKEAFDDDPKHPRYIQTIPKSGYGLLPRPELIPIVAQSAIQEASTQTELAISQRSLQRRQIFSICAVAILLIGIATVWYLLSRPSAANVHSMLAVLPFQNLSNDPEQEYFADGLTAEMISQLAVSLPISSVLSTGTQ